MRGKLLPLALVLAGSAAIIASAAVIGGAEALRVVGAALLLFFGCALIGTGFVLLG